MFIIDFDDTLFDTEAFKQSRIKVLQEIGVSEDLFKQTYQKAYANALGINTYNDGTHATALATYGFDLELVKKTLEVIKSHIKDFLFPDTLDFLQFLKQTDQKLILLSLGEANFQKMKIVGSDIEIFFDQIFTVNDIKENIIQQVVSSYANEPGIWFINDKIEETKKIIQQFPRLKPILKMSPRWPEEEYKLSLMPYFSTLSEIKEYVQEQIK